MKSQHAIKRVKFLHDQQGLAIGELIIFCNIFLSQGILALFCLTPGGGTLNVEVIGMLVGNSFGKP